MARCKKDKEFADDARLLRWWQAWHREQREAVLAGPHGVALSELFRMFKNLRHAQPSQLSGFARSINWSTIDYDTKLVVRARAQHRHRRISRKNGLAPLDDNLPGETETPFRIVRAIVLTASPHDEGAHRGGARPK